MGFIGMKEWYKKPVCITKKDLEDVLEIENDEGFKIVVLDQIEPGVVYICSEPKFIDKFDVRDLPFEFPLGIEMKFSILKREVLEGFRRCLTYGEASIKHGVTCSKCNEFYEHAEWSVNFECWGCRNGY